MYSHTLIMDLFIIFDICNGNSRRFFLKTYRFAYNEQSPVSTNQDQFPKIA